MAHLPSLTCSYILDEMAFLFLVYHFNYVVNL